RPCSSRRCLLPIPPRRSSPFRSTPPCDYLVGRVARALRSRCRPYRPPQSRAPTDDTHPRWPPARASARGPPPTTTWRTPVCATSRSRFASDRRLAPTPPPRNSDPPLLVSCSPVPPAGPRHLASPRSPTAPAHVPPPPSRRGDR